MRFAAFAVASLALTAPSLAQEQAVVKSGEEARLGWIGSVGENCQANPVPTITPAELAKHGQIKLVQGQVQTNTVPECPGITIPAIVVFYTSSPSFKGSDSFSLSTGDGKPDRTYTVSVQ
jgi:hypothetical protein